jgi:hypothetical protein
MYISAICMELAVSFADGVHLLSHAKVKTKHDYYIKT